MKGGKKMKEVTVEDKPVKSDIGRLSDELDSLISTLRAFETDITSLHSEVFKEPMKEESKVEADEAPRNKIIELIDKVKDCFDIQENIRKQFSDLNSVLK